MFVIVVAVLLLCSLAVRQTGVVLGRFFLFLNACVFVCVVEVAQIHCDQTLVKNPFFDESQQLEQPLEDADLKRAKIRMFCQHPVYKMEIGHKFSVHVLDLPQNNEKSTSVKSLCDEITEKDKDKDKICDFTHLEKILSRKCHISLSL